MTAINPKLPTTGLSFLSAPTNSQSTSKQPTKTSTSGNASWLPSTKTAATAGGILATLGAGYLTYQHLTNNTIPHDVTPSSSLGTIFKTLAGITIFASITRFALKQTNTPQNNLKPEAEIQDAQVNKFVTNLEALKVEDYGYPKEFEIFDSIIDYLKDTSLPLNDDQKKLTKSLAASLKDRLNDNKLFALEKYMASFEILLKADKDSALELAKTALSIEWKGNKLNLIEIASFYNEKIYYYGQFSNNFIEQIIHSAFNNESGIKTDLYQYCMQNTRQCPNTAEIYKAPLANDFFLMYNDFTFIKLFLEECALLDDKAYAEFQKNVVWKLLSHLQKNTLTTEMQFCIQDMFLQHNHNMFFHFFDAAIYANNGTCPPELFRNAAGILTTYPEIMEKLDISIEKSLTKRNILSLIQFEIKKYVAAKEKLKTLKTLPEIIQHIEQNTNLYPDFLKDESDEFFTNLSSLILQNLSYWNDQLVNAYDLLSMYRKNETRKLATECFKRLLNAKEYTAIFSNCSLILGKAYRGEEGISLAIDFIKDLERNSNNELNTTYSKKFNMFIKSFFDSVTDESKLNLLEESTKLDYPNFNKHFTKYFIKEKRDDTDTIFKIANILFKTNNRLLIDFYIDYCSSLGLNEISNYATNKCNEQYWTKNKKAEEHENNVPSTYQPIDSTNTSHFEQSDPSLEKVILH